MEPKRTSASGAVPQLILPPPTISDSLKSNLAPPLDEGAAVEGHENGEERRKSGLGVWALLDDYMISRFIFSFFCIEGPLIVSRLMQVSHAFHQFASWEKTWMKIAMNLSAGQFEYEHSWRFTAKKIALRLRKEKIEKETGIIQPNFPIPSESYTQISGFYSAYMFRIWYRYYHSYQLFNKGVHDSGIIERIPTSTKFTQEQFVVDYDRPRKPFVLSGICKKWKAWGQWTTHGLVQRFPDHIVKCAQPNQKGERLVMTIRNYITYLRTNMDEKPLYVFDSGFAKRIPALREEYEIPKPFVQDLFSCLGVYRPDYRWYLIGPTRSGTGWHIDPNGTAAWNALLAGRKWWLLYPPDITPPGVWVDYYSDGSIKKWKSASPLKWMFDEFPKITGLPQPIQLIQYPGDMIYVPSGWWHMVINIEDTISVTQNFVNSQNLGAAVRSLYNSRRNKELLKIWLDRLYEISPQHYKEVKHKIKLLDGEKDKRKLASLEKKKEQWKVQKEGLLKKQKEDQDKQNELLQQIIALTQQLEKLKQ